jgi:hypothetical protein
MVIFLVGLVVGLVWGSGVTFLWKDAAEKKRWIIFLRSTPIVLWRMRVLRNGVFN